jgi:Transposase domain (DUF772)
LFPALLDDYLAEDNPVRAVDVFVDGLDLDKLGFVGVQPLDTGRPGYHPGMMLKLYIYGYLNRVPSSRRLERECQRNIEMIWLTRQLAPDFKTIADFRKDTRKKSVALKASGAKPPPSFTGPLFAPGNEGTHRAHSGNPAFRRPSINSFELSNQSDVYAKLFHDVSSVNDRR